VRDEEGMRRWGEEVERMKEGQVGVDEVEQVMEDEAVEWCGL
jgi:hypothetical protein